MLVGIATNADLGLNPLHWTDTAGFNCLSIGSSVVGSCEHDDEPFSSIVWWGISLLAEWQWVSLEGLYSVELMV